MNRLRSLFIFGFIISAVVTSISVGPAFASTSFSTDVLQPFKSRLNSAFNKNWWQPGKLWGLRHHGGIDVSERAGVGHILIHGVTLHVDTGRTSLRFDVGDIAMVIQPSDGEHVVVDAAFGNTVLVESQGDNSQLRTISFGKKSIAFTWNSALQTIVEHAIELSNIRVINEHGDGGADTLAKINQISSKGNLVEGKDRLWSGMFDATMEGVSISSLGQIEDMTFLHRFDAVAFAEYAEALVRADRTGALGSWVYGGLLTTHQGLLSAALQGDTVDILSALETVSSLVYKRTIEVRVKALEILNNAVGLVEFVDQTVFENGNLESEGQATLKGIEFSGLEADRTMAGLFPSVIEGLTSMSAGNVPASYRALIDLEQRSPGVISKLSDPQDSSDVYAQLEPAIRQIVDNGANGVFERFEIRSPNYEFAFNGSGALTNGSALGYVFDADLRVRLSDDLYRLFQGVMKNKPQLSRFVPGLEFKPITPGGAGLGWEAKITTQLKDTAHLYVNGVNTGSPLSLDVVELAGLLLKLISQSSTQQLGDPHSTKTNN